MNLGPKYCIQIKTGYSEQILNNIIFKGSYFGLVFYYNTYRCLQCTAGLQPSRRSINLSEVPQTPEQHISSSQSVPGEAAHVHSIPCSPQEGPGLPRAAQPVGWAVLRPDQAPPKRTWAHPHSPLKTSEAELCS